MGRTKTRGSLGMQWFTTGVSTTLVLILLGAVSFFILFAHRLSESVKENLTVTLLLTGEATEAEIGGLRVRLEKSACVAEAEYISKEQALQEQIEVMGSDPSEFLGANPYRASFEVRMKAAYANSDSLAQIAARLKKEALVDDVIYQRELVDMVNDNLHRISLVLLCLAALLALVSFALINNTVRLGIYSGRFIIRTMKLVGAGWGFIRRPFMVRSFVLGLLSGLSADAVVYGGIQALLRQDPSLARYIEPELLAVVGGAVLLFGLLLTLGCTYFSVRKYLRMKACELY